MDQGEESNLTVLLQLTKLSSDVNWHYFDFNHWNKHFEKAINTFYNDITDTFFKIYSSVQTIYNFLGQLSIVVEDSEVGH